MKLNTLSAIFWSLLKTTDWKALLQGACENLVSISLSVFAALLLDHPNPQLYWSIHITIVHFRQIINKGSMFIV